MEFLASPSARTPSELRAVFQNPDRRFSPLPFWWWVGEPLKQERLIWQLDQLRARGVHGAIVGYNHFLDGRNDPGDPAVFSREWWALFRDVLEVCRERGMVLGFQDYTLINPALLDLAREYPEMAGHELMEKSARVESGQEVKLKVPPGFLPLTCVAYALDTKPNEAISVVLTDQLHSGQLQWICPGGRWLVSLVVGRPQGFDPMHSLSGQRVIERYFSPFKAHCPEYLGHTLAIFFQDELEFGLRMPWWSTILADEFLSAKGYALLPRLPELWHDVGPRSAKVRIDYADVVVRLMEKNYFAPIHAWHERHGTLFGHDNCGRGAIGTGRSFYADYFRAMRWYSAPGSDDPRLQGPRGFQGIKMSSSIAHLYGRPRVWIESFHSSGWGASPAQMIAALNEDFQLGANLVNLHGLYYTTFGSWWEWAAPDFHFRQPYWIHAQGLNDYITRLSAILSEGRHVTNTAILYPVTALEAGLNRPASQVDTLPGSLSELQRGESTAVDSAEAAAFQIGRQLIDGGGDFDFIDFESLDRATFEDGALQVAGESYRNIVLPGMSGIRFSNALKLQQFFRQGGQIFAFGPLPRASDRAGREDAELEAIVSEIFGASTATSTRENIHTSGGRSLWVDHNRLELVDAIRGAHPPDFNSDATALQCLHRAAAGCDLYFLRNPLDKSIDANVTLIGPGRPQAWDAWTGQTTVLAFERKSNDRASLLLKFGPKEARLIVLSLDPSASSHPPPITGEIVTVDTFPSDGWRSSLEPTMDNRHGDFRLPRTEEELGPEVRTFRFREETDSPESWSQSDIDDSTWEEATCSYGQRFWRLGPIPPSEGQDKLTPTLRALRSIDPRQPLIVEGKAYRWQPYAISLEWGIEKDPFMSDWASGPHGLKKKVPDEFIDAHCDNPGASWYFWTQLVAPRPGSYPFVVSSRAAFSVAINGCEHFNQSEALPAGHLPPWNFPYYDASPLRGEVELRAGGNPLLLHFRQPPDQRVRAYAAIEAESVQDRPTLRWFAHEPEWTFNPRPDTSRRTIWLRFTTPPGLKSLHFFLRGTIDAAWADGVPLAIVQEINRSDRSNCYTLRPQAPANETVIVAIRVLAFPDAFGGDVIPSPIKVECGNGQIHLGDWCDQGLTTYSGALWYRRSFEVSEAWQDHGWYLDLGRVEATAEVLINGQSVGQRVAPPYRFEITSALKVGKNDLAIQIANTLGNHYSVGIPTPYAFPDQTASGLFGPVRLLRQLRA